MNGVDDLAVIDSLQIDRGNPEVRVAELPLDHVEQGRPWLAAAVRETVRQLAVPSRRASSLRALLCVVHGPTRSDAQGDAEAQPRVDPFPRAPIHAGLASLAP